jgi:NitT/TauT family transport system substrate-binding protein
LKHTLFAGSRRALSGTFVLSAALLVGAREAEAQSAASLQTVELGVTGRPDQAPMELAFRRGYFAEQGLDIHMVPATSGNEFVAPLATNQLDVASGSPTAALINALNRNIDIRIVADYAHVGARDDGAISIVMRKDLADSGAVKTVADLRGRSIAAGNGRGQVGNLVVRVMLQNADVRSDEVDVRSMNFVDALAAMASKSLDAAYLVEPLVTQSQAQNVARIFMKGSDIRAGTELSVLLYSPGFAQRTDLATGFMIAFLRGVRDYYDAFFRKKDRDAAIDIVTKYLPVKDRKIWEASMPQTTDLNGRVDVADIQQQAAIYKSFGDITGTVPDIAKYVDPQFAAGAVAKLGAR